MERKEEIKQIISQKMYEAKTHAEKYGFISAVIEIGLWYTYACNANEKAALHIIIETLRKNPIAKPYLPSLPEIDNIED